jgi:hypothetical protein
VPLALEMDEAFNRVEIGLPYARALAFDATEVAGAIAQKHRRNVHHQTGLFGPRIGKHSHDSLELCFGLASVVYPIGAEYSGEGAPYLPGALAPHV